MQSSIRTEITVYQSYGHCDSQGISVFERNCTLQTLHVICQADVIVIRCQSFLHHHKCLPVLSAECYLSLVVSDKFIAGARASYGANVPYNAFCGQFSLPVFGIADKSSVLEVDKSFCDAQHRYCRVEFAEYVLKEPVHAETAYASNDKIAPFDGFLPLFELIIRDPFRERGVEFWMNPVFTTRIDDFSVKGSSDKSHLISVFAGRKSECASHHSASDDCNPFSVHCI